MATPIITIDGPAASGKGTLAKRLASTLGFYYLDSGAIYRLLALKILSEGLDPDNEDQCVKAARAFVPEFDPARMSIPDIRTERVSDATSRSSRFEGVRAALLEIQRGVAHNPPAPFKGAVLEGRDTGTVVCPDADLKIFLTATAEARAQRRTKELLSRGETVTYEAVLQNLKERDERDSTRAVAPLKPAQDAATVDTSGMDADAALGFVLDLVRKRLASAA
ncbi:MAG: (d)CMP kinase [Alphaproteobacteria bacterium]|nr:(d)CMP kinase [Alphaproteobacteria bacterium]